MIQNERQYSVAKAQAQRLTDALGAAKAHLGEIDARVGRAMLAGIESQIAELKSALREYERLRRTASLRIGSSGELPQLLIKARIARGCTQKQLAEKLGLRE